jgi:predicted peroxiredoxin
VRSYLFLESRSDLDSPDVPATLALAGQLRGEGHQVAVFLVQNAVTMVGRPATLDELHAAGVQVWADDHSLAVRGLPEPAGAVRLGGAPDMVRLLMTPDVIPVWH